MSSTMARFTYDRMSGEEFIADLNALEMTTDAFARIFGADLRGVNRWVSGQKEIPVWVPITLAMMRNPGAIPIARREVAEWLKFDNENPSRGEYPYKEQADDD